MQTNDELWQGALEDFAEEFIQKFYPKLYRQLDRSKPDLKIDLMRRLLERNVSKVKIRRLLVFINGYLRFEKPNNKHIFEEKYDKLLNHDKKMGIEEIAKRIAHREGLQEGRQEAMSEAEYSQRQKNNCLKYA